MGLSKKPYATWVAFCRVEEPSTHGPLCVERRQDSLIGLGTGSERPLSKSHTKGVRMRVKPGVTSRHRSCPHDGSQRIRHTHLNGAGLSRVGVHIAERAFFKIPIEQIFHVKVQPDLVIDLVVAQ